MKIALAQLNSVVGDICGNVEKILQFARQAKEKGADLIATGHYSRIKDGELYKGLDESKDQSYFLYRVESKALKRSLMPIGEYKKSEVRLMAKKRNLYTSDKKDSQGICFVGEVGIKEFLTHELGPQKPGDILDDHEKNIGRHDGAIFYTIGQRHGLNVGGGLPYYVSKKDMKNNIVYVTTDLNNASLWRREIQLSDVHWINQEPKKSQEIEVRLRYRGPLIKTRFEDNKLKLSEPARGIAAGQSAVIYKDDEVLGGGIIT